MHKDCSINGVVLAVTYLYLSLPIMIFLLGWCKGYIGIPGFLIILFSLLLCLKEHTENIDFDKDVMNKSTYKILFAILIIAIWVAISGVGSFVWQNEDHWYRNAMFDLLVDEKWPVVKTIDNSERGFVYYIGYWLPAALIGKVWGRTAGYFAQYIWGILGITLLYLIICEWKKKVVIWPLIVFIFFSGLDCVGMILQTGAITDILGTEHLERWIGSYQYSSFTTQLFWVFNQAIPAWLACALIFLVEKPRNIVYTWSLIMITSTLPFVGLLPYIIYYLVTRCSWGGCNHIKGLIGRLWKNWGSIQNILAGGIIGFITFLYLVGNVSGGIVKTTTNQGSRLILMSSIDGSEIKMFVRFVLFFSLEAGVFLFCLKKKVKEGKLFYLTAVILFVVPMIKVGESIDFCMRASIPALFMIYLWCIETLDNKKKDHISRILIIVLILGAITPTHEISRTIVNTLQPYEIQNVGGNVILTGGNFSGEANGIFWKYIAK